MVIRRRFAIVAMALFFIGAMLEASISAASGGRAHVMWADCAAGAAGVLLLLSMWRFRSRLPQNLFGAFAMTVGGTLFGLLIIATGFGLLQATRYCLDRWSASPLSTVQWHTIRQVCLFTALGADYLLIRLIAGWVKKKRHRAVEQNATLDT